MLGVPGALLAVVFHEAACLGLVGGRHGSAAAAKWGLGDWIHKGAPKAAREAPLAVALCPVQHCCTGELLRGGNGPR